MRLAVTFNYVSLKDQLEGCWTEISPVFWPVCSMSAIARSLSSLANEARWLQTGIRCMTLEEAE
jgi:hypothetical protein